MKNIFRILSACLIGASLLSCSDFLEEKPTTQLSESTVYSNPSVLEAQVFGIYAALHTSNMPLARMYEFFQTGSGLISWKGSRTTDDWLSNIKFSRYSDQGNSNVNWFGEICTAINRCNRLIDNLPGSPVDAAFKAGIEGEAKFLRAYLFFMAVRIWGDFPLMISSPKSVKEVNNPRTAWYKVYAQIIKDLEFAEQNMCTHAELVGVYRDSRYLKGRPCNTAATALKASVYITIASLLNSPDDNFWDSSKDAALEAAGKDPRTPDFSSIGINSAADAYKLAYDTASDVITCGDYSLVGNYYKLFTWGWRPEGQADTEGEDWLLPERIFCLQSTDMAGTNYYSIYGLPQGCPWTSNASTTNSNWGRVRPDRFFINEFIKRTGGTLGDKTFNTEFYVNTEDPRFNASFFHNFNILAAGQKPTDTPTGTKRTCYPNQNYDPESTDEKTLTSNATYMPYTRKPADPTFDVTKGKADMYIIRFAEMYLIRAEAAANLSTGPGDDKWNEALADIETLHDRARKSFDPRTETGPTGATYPTWKFTTFSNKAELVNAIIWERFIELNFEGHEWFDTHRFGATWLRDNIAIPKNDFSELSSQKAVYNYIYHKLRPHPENVQDIRKGLLSAYPERELRVNTSLDVLNDQNDFFWQ